MFYGEQEAAERLKPSLTAALQKWADDNCDSDEWLAFDMYVGNNFAKYMSDAAMAVLMSMADCQAYIREHCV